MAMQQRPGRNTTRVRPAPGAPAPAPAPAKAGPSTRSVRPGTGPVPKQPAPAAQPAGRAASTRSVAKQSSSRPVPKQAPKNNMPLIIGLAVGVVVLIVIAAVVMGGGSEKPATHAPKETSKPKVVDVSSLEKEGYAKCDEGLALIKKNETALGSHSLSEGQKSALKADLEKGRKLISDGMGLLTQANEKSKGNTYDTKQYQEALITVRKKLMELRD